MKVKNILSSLLLLFLLSGCVVYSPHVVDIPLISQKGDLRVDAGISAVGGYQSTISYGITDKLAVQAHGNFAGDKAYMIQAAVGNYKNTGNNYIREIYLGFDFGKADAYRDATGGHLRGSYQLYFAQWNFGKTQIKFANMDLGIGIKTGILYSSLDDYNYYSQQITGGAGKNYKDYNYLLEPGLLIKMGGKNLKFDIKFSGCYLYKFTNRNLGFPYAYLNLGLGLNFGTIINKHSSQ